MWRTAQQQNDKFIKENNSGQGKKNDVSLYSSIALNSSMSCNYEHTIINMNIAFKSKLHLLRMIASIYERQ